MAHFSSVLTALTCDVVTTSQSGSHSAIWKEFTNSLIHQTDHFEHGGYMVVEV